MLSGPASRAYSQVACHQICAAHLRSLASAEYCKIKMYYFFHVSCWIFVLILLSNCSNRARRAHMLIAPQYEGMQRHCNRNSSKLWLSLRLLCKKMYPCGVWHWLPDNCSWSKAFCSTTSYERGILLPKPQISMEIAKSLSSPRQFQPQLPSFHWSVSRQGSLTHLSSGSTPCCSHALLAPS